MSSKSVITTINIDRLSREKTHRTPLIFLKTKDGYEVFKDRVSGFRGKITEATMLQLKRNLKIWKRELK